MNKKKIIVLIASICIVLIGIIGSVAYFMREYNGNIKGSVGKFVFDVKANNETFADIDLYKTMESPTITDEEVIVPGDSGSFTLDVNAKGSSATIIYDIIINGSNVPTNMKFYLGEKELPFNSYTYLSGKLEKGTEMKESYKIDWEWPYYGDVDDDVKFAGKDIKITVKVMGIQSNANVYVDLYDHIKNQPNNGVDTNINFALEADSSNGEGINIVSGTENNTYPIYYYRGDIYNNNIIYAGYCWLIVRTTETGGIKLLYNGVPTNGKCDGSNNSIGKVSFNAIYNISSTVDISPIYVGYMYGLTPYNGVSLSAYKTHLEDISIIDTSNTSTETIGNKTFNIAGRHTQNAKSSTIKIKLDTWYQQNIEGTEYESILEDTVWCNDRSISTINTIDNFSSTGNFDYAVRDRLNNKDKTVNPSLKCAREVDKFTVNSSNGNGDLEYPIGLLTADEIAFAGNRSTYISSKSSTFIERNVNGLVSLSPRNYDFSTNGFYLFLGALDPFAVNNDCGTARPSISLRQGTKITGVGDGTSAKPYRVVVE